MTDNVKQDGGRSKKDVALAVAEMAVLATSLGLNVLLASMVLHRNAAPAPMVSVRAGAEVVSLRAKRCNGTSVTVQFAKRSPTVLYVFSPTCEWCKRNALNINRLYAARRSTFRFFGINQGGNAACTMHSGYAPPFTWVIDPAASAASKLKLGPTPETIVVSNTGTVEKVWTGAFTDTMLSSVDEYFRVQLPGLLPTHIQSTQPIRGADDQ